MKFNLLLKYDGLDFVYTYAVQQNSSDVTSLLDWLEKAGIQFRDLETMQNSLEEIFVNLVKK